MQQTQFILFRLDIVSNILVLLCIVVFVWSIKMSAPASASTSSINMHNFDFGFDSPVPILNFPSDDKVDPGSPNSFTWVYSLLWCYTQYNKWLNLLNLYNRQELTRLQEEQLHFARKIEKEKFRKEILEKETEVIIFICILL